MAKLLRLSSVITTDCFLQCDWRRESSFQKVIVNEARGISQMSPDPLLLGGWGLGTRLIMQGVIIILFNAHHKFVEAWPL